MVFPVSYLNVLSLAFLSGLATLSGVFIGSRSRKSNVNFAFGASFAAGIMVLISLFELIPEAYSNIGNRSIVWVIFGLLALWFLNAKLPHAHSVREFEGCGEDSKCVLKISYLLAIGLILHDFPEGFAIPSSFAASSSLGITLIAATFIHNIPEGYILTVASSASNRSFCYKSAFMSAVSTLLGAVIGVVLVHLFDFLNPIFLSVAAGAMLFISLHELLPMGLKKKRIKMFSLGAGVSVLIFFFLNLIF